MPFYILFLLLIFPRQIFTSDNDFAEFEDPDDMSTSHSQNQVNHKPRSVDFVEHDTDAIQSSNESPVNLRNSPLDDEMKGKAKIASENQEEAFFDDLNNSPQPSLDSMTVENDEDEDLSHFNDNEEFEGFEIGTPDLGQSKDNKRDIKIAKVPHHLSSGWESYVLELVMLAGLVVYMLAFLVGKSKNQRLAENWLQIHRDVLTANFSLVGDDGGQNPNSGQLNKEAEHLYSLWCSGRVCVEGMLVELRLLKRQDLISIIAGWLKPAQDHVHFTCRLDPGEMLQEGGGFVCALVQRKRVNTLLKEAFDLAFFCPDKKTPPRPAVPDCFVMLSEIGEATLSVLDAGTCKLVEECADIIDYIHISDQYSPSSRQAIEQDSPNIVAEPKLEKVIIVSLKIGRKGHLNQAQLEETKPILKLIFYLIERVRKVKLSKEARLKSEKNRRKAIESFQRQLHSQRQEAAQQRREEKRRLEKERLLAEEDPDKARKLEERDNKKEAKRKQPKTKMLKVKGM